MGRESRGGGFEFVIASSLPPQRSLERLLDVRLHGDLVPLTRGSGPRPQDVVVGSRLVARTAVGPIGFDDVMEIVELESAGPPECRRRAVLEKRGSLIGGRIVIESAPTSSGSVVSWDQRLEFPFLPRPVNAIASRLAAPLVGRGYRFMVGRLLALSAHTDAAHA